MTNNLVQNSLNAPLAGLSQDLLRIREVTDTYVKERLSQAAKSNRNWCSFYNKHFNVGWIIGQNSIFFFQYKQSQTTVTRSIVEFPKGQYIGVPEQVKVFKRNKDLYALVIYSNTIQISKILCPTEEKDLIEVLRFPRQGEKVISVSESWEEGPLIYLTIFTNKNSLYLLQLETRMLDLKLDFTVTLHILNRKTKLLQKIKSYIAPENDLEDGQVFCHMQKRPNDPSISVGRIYDVFSYAEGKLEVFTLNFEQQKGKFLLSSHLYKWVINLRSILDHELSKRLGEKGKKFQDLEILDIIPEMTTRYKPQVSLKILLRAELASQTHLESYFSYVTITLNDLSGSVQTIEEYIIGDGFALPLAALENRDQLSYGRIVACLDDNVYLCTHFSLKPKEGMIEIEDLQQAQTNLFVQIESDRMEVSPFAGKILGAGHYFDYEHNEEDVLLLITEVELIKAKVLKHMTISQGLPIRQPQISMAQSIRVAQPIRRLEPEELQPSNRESILSFSVGNVLGSKFKEMLSNVRDNLPAVKQEVNNILHHHSAPDIWNGLKNFTDEILQSKNRNLVLVSTYMSPKRSKKKENKPESSDILLHEIKKKLKIMNAWIDFLKKLSLWDIQDPIRELVYSNREKLVAALKLRDCQINLNTQAVEDLNASRNKDFLSQAIIKCLEKMRLAAQYESDYVNNDVFYTKIVDFSLFLITLLQLHEEIVIGQGSYAYLSFVTQIIVGIFNALYEERTTQNYENISLWTQEQDLLKCIHSLLIRTIEALKKGELEASKLKEDLSYLGYILIREYNNIRKLWPEELDWDRKLDEIYDALLENQLLADVGKYAEEFIHMDVMSRLYYQYNYDHHIKELFSRWKATNFLERFIDNYVAYLKLNAGKVTGPFKLFLDFEEYNQQIQEYVSRKYPQIAWLLLIKNGEFIMGERLLRQVTAGETLVRNRLAEASVGRLCTSFHDIHATSDYDKLIRIDLAQSQAMTDKQIRAPDELIKRLLSQKTTNFSANIHACLKVLGNILRNSYYGQVVADEYKNLLTLVLQEAIKSDMVLIGEINNLLNIQMPEQMITDKVAQTCLWEHFDKFVYLIEEQGYSMENFVSKTMEGNEQIIRVVEQMRALKETSGMVIERQI